MTSSLVKQQPFAFIGRKPHLLAGFRAPSPQALAAAVVAASVCLSLAYIWFLCPLDLSSDEAHYWEWSLHLDWSYYSKGPLVAWLIRASCELFGPASQSIRGDLAAAVRMPAVACHAALLAGSYVLAAGVFRSPRLGLMVVVAEAGLPLVRVGSVLMTIDPPFLACWCWALVCVWKAIAREEENHRSPRIGLISPMGPISPISDYRTTRETFSGPCCWRIAFPPGTRYWFAAGVLALLGTLAKYTMALFPAAIMCFVVFHHRSAFRRPGVWLFLTGAGLAWVPIVAWNAGHDWVSFRHVLGQVGGQAIGLRFNWLGPASFVAAQLGMLFGGWLLAFLAAGWRFRPKRHHLSPLGGGVGLFPPSPSGRGAGGEGLLLTSNVSHEPSPPASLPEEEETESGLRLLWWCAAPVWALFAAASLVKSGQPNWPAPAYVGGMILAVAWVRQELAGPYRRTIGLALAATVTGSLVALVAVHFPRLVRPALAGLVPPPSATKPLPVRDLDITARLTGWQTLAAEVDRVRTEVVLATGEEPILAGTNWTIPGHLRFYCKGHPQAYALGLANASDRHSQYDYWRPNPQEDAQAFSGRTFVIVGDVGPGVCGSFAHVEPGIWATHAENGVPIASWQIRVCRGFHGFPEPRHRAGY